MTPREVIKLGLDRSYVTFVRELRRLGPRGAPGKDATLRTAWFLCCTWGLLTSVPVGRRCEVSARTVIPRRTPAQPLQLLMHFALELAPIDR